MAPQSERTVMSYTGLYNHIIFSTKGRKPLIRDSIKQRLFSYIAGIAVNLECKILVVNGVADHIHLLISISPKISVAELVRKIKSNSSRWIHEMFLEHKAFRWQDGYSAFSVSYSGVNDVSKYIKSQQEHHKTVSFAEELKIFLAKHKINYDPKFLE